MKDIFPCACWVFLSRILAKSSPVVFNRLLFAKHKHGKVTNLMKLMNLTKPQTAQRVPARMSQCACECEPLWVWVFLANLDLDCDFFRHFWWMRSMATKYAMVVAAVPPCPIPSFRCRWLSSALVATTLQSISVDIQSVRQSINQSVTQSVSLAIPRLVSNCLWLSTRRPVAICDRLKLKLNRNQRILGLESRTGDYIITTTTCCQG